jgi:hypothetical protein
VKGIHKTIKSNKPWVQFGISPFGVWKNKSTDPKGSDTKAGQTTYEDLYADPLTWMENSWIDYLVPQVYWSMDLPVASHTKIVDWWSNNSSNTNLYIGNGAYKIRSNSDKAWENKKEIPNQLRLARKTEPVNGNVFFSAKSLMNKNKDVVELIKKKYYKNKALPPISPLSPIIKNEAITLDAFKKESGLIQLKFKNIEHHRYVMVYASGRKKKSDYPMKKLISKVLINDNQVNLPSNIFDDKKQIALTFITKFGQESDPILIHLN